MTRRGKVFMAIFATVIFPLAAGYLFNRFVFELEFLLQFRLLLGLAFLILWYLAAKLSCNLGAIAHLLFFGVPGLMFLLNLIPYSAMPGLLNVLCQGYFLPPMWIVSYALALLPATIVREIWMFHLASVVLMGAIYLTARKNELKRRPC